MECIIRDDAYLSSDTVTALQRSSPFSWIKSSDGLLRTENARDFPRIKDAEDPDPLLAKEEMG